MLLPGAQTQRLSCRSRADPVNLPFFNTYPRRFGNFAYPARWKLWFFRDLCWICCCVHLDPESSGFRPELPCVYSSSPNTNVPFIARGLASDQSIWGMPGEWMGVVEACSTSYPPFNTSQLLLLRGGWYHTPKSSRHFYFKTKSWLFLSKKNFYV